MAVVLYSDDAVLVISKRPGQVMHSAPGHSYETTLAYELLRQFPDLDGVGECGQPGMVHRIDKDTGGLVVVARTQVAYSALKEQIVTRALKRLYLACVARPPVLGGVWCDVLGRSGRQRMRVVRSYEHKQDLGIRCDPEKFEKLAVLEARVLVAGCGIGLITYALDTGVQHQIRCQSSARGCPVIGDELYGRRNRHALSAEYGMLLHAYCLSFVHPVSKERIEIVDHPQWLGECCAAMKLSLCELSGKF